MRVINSREGETSEISEASQNNEKGGGLRTIESKGGRKVRQHKKHRTGNGVTDGV